MVRFTSKRVSGIHSETLFRGIAWLTKHRNAFIVLLLVALVVNLNTSPDIEQLDGVDEIRRHFTSPHRLDCHDMKKDVDDLSKGNLFVTTKTLPSFQMSIHDPEKDFVSNHIHVNGCWECEHVKEMVEVLSSHKDSYFLDIGGNIGMWSLAAAAAKKDTFTIEPSRENFERICATVNKNSFHNQVHLLTIAATKEESVFELAIPDGNKGGTRVKGVDAKSNGDSSNVIKGFPIDSLGLPTDRPVGIKIDVEGHEAMALSGAMEFLSEANIVYVFMELRDGNGHGSLKRSQKIFTDAFNVFTSKGLVPFRKDGKRETELDPKHIDEWKHHKRPSGQFDVAWKKRD